MSISNLETVRRIGEIGVAALMVDQSANASLRVSMPSL